MRFSRPAAATALASAAVLSLALTGCTASSGGSDEEITLSITTFGTFGYEDLYAEYEELHPDITIEATNIDTGGNARTDAFNKIAFLVEHGDFTPASGADAMSRLLDRGEPIDGLFAASAQMADGALTVLRARGLRVPEDLGVVTFDDDYFAQRAVPPLTTVDQDEGEVGVTMAELLMRAIEGEDVPRITMMPTRLIRRGSE